MTKSSVTVEAAQTMLSLSRSTHGSELPKSKAWSDSIHSQLTHSSHHGSADWMIRCLTWLSSWIRIIGTKSLSQLSPLLKLSWASSAPPQRMDQLTRALLGGGRLNAPPSGFSRMVKKRRRAAPPRFHPPYPPSFPQLLWKFRPNVMWGQVTRSGQVTQLQNNFPIAPRLQCLRESYETFGIWWGHQCLQNVYLGFFISVT